MTAAAGAKPTVFLRDYRAPAWCVRDVELVFDLDPVETIVAARLAVEADSGQPGAPLRLDGEGLELLELRVDGRVLAAGEYALDAKALTIPGLSHAAIVETRARIAPERNTALQGLYLSGDRDSGFLLTQCEAEGFRRITWFVDRPDVLARYVVTLRADKAAYPVLLSNGNLVEAGDLPEGEHLGVEALHLRARGAVAVESRLQNPFEPRPLLHQPSRTGMPASRRCAFASWMLCVR